MLGHPGAKCGIPRGCLGVGLFMKHSLAPFRDPIFLIISILVILVPKVGIFLKKLVSIEKSVPVTDELAKFLLSYFPKATCLR